MVYKNQCHAGICSPSCEMIYNEHMYRHGFSKDEFRLLRSLKTPRAVQDFVDTIPINFEENGETLRSPRNVLRERKAHCMEGALVAAAAFLIQGRRPLLLQLRTTDEDEDHVVALFTQHGRWGAVSKTNHAALRWRESIYKTTRELAISYFHEYFLDDGRRTLRAYSRPLDLSLRKFSGWTIAEHDLWNLSEAMDALPYYQLIPSNALCRLRKADLMEQKAGAIVEWRRQ